MEIEIHELDQFEGQRPGGTRLKLNGFAPQRTSPLHEGDEIVVLVRAKVKKVTFNRDAKVGLLREHTAKIVEAYQVPDGEQHSANEWLQDHRIAHKVAMDRLAGQLSIDEEPTEEELRDEEARLKAAEDVELLSDEERKARDEDHTDEEEWMRDPDRAEPPDEEESEAIRKARELAEKEGPAVTPPRASRRKQPAAT